MEMMGTGATSTVLIMTSATAARAMASSTVSSTMDMASSSSSSSMTMSMYLTTSYLNTPVIFKSLYATNKATCFAIFVMLFFTGFTFRGFSFLSAYIEQKIFRDDTITNIISEIENDLNKGNIKLDDASLASSIEDLEINRLRKYHSNQFNDAKHRSPLAQFVNFTPQSVYQDFIILILTFTQLLLAYALMLAVMTCVLPYFFAVLLGISFGEIFFVRLGYCMGMISQTMNGSIH